MEIEIKLVALPGGLLEPDQVLAEAEAVGLRPGPASMRDLDARYHDDPDGTLRRARWTLRCRGDGGTWTAGIKGPGPMVAGIRGRIEVEVPLPAAAIPGDPLPRELLLATKGPLPGLLTWPEVAFRADVRRTASVLDLAEVARIELAIDRGHVRAGGRRSPVAEIEVELLQGDPSALPLAALRLADRLPVRPGTRSKAARGLGLLGLLDDPTVPPPGAPAALAWEAFCELEERRIDGDVRWLDAEARLAGELGIGPAPGDPGWTAAMWRAFASVTSG